MAQNSRVAASSQNAMVRSTASVDSFSSNEGSSGQGQSRVRPDSQLRLNGENGIHTDLARIQPDHEIDSSPDNTTDNQRFLFPSVTSWYSELNKTHAVTVILLVYCNLINYMDRSTVAGMISFIKEDKDFNVKSDKKLGLLQVLFRNELYLRLQALIIMFLFIYKYVNTLIIHLISDCICDILHDNSTSIWIPWGPLQSKMDSCSWA